MWLCLGPLYTSTTSLSRQVNEQVNACVCLLCTSVLCSRVRGPIVHLPIRLDVCVHGEGIAVCVCVCENKVVAGRWTESIHLRSWSVWVRLSTVIQRPYVRSYAKFINKTFKRIARSVYILTGSLFRLFFSSTHVKRQSFVYSCRRSRMCTLLCVCVRSCQCVCPCVWERLFIRLPTRIYSGISNICSAKRVKTSI